MRTKIFFDTEFTGLHQDTTLISIGLISECSKTFYAEFTDFDQAQVSDWVNNHVLGNLELIDNEDSLYNKAVADCTVSGDSELIKNELSKWLSQFGDVELWSDCLAYDWVLFCELFGGAQRIPDSVYYIPFDLCTLLKVAGVDPDISREEYAGVDSYKYTQIGPGNKKHNALWDAKIIRLCYITAVLQLDRQT